MRNFMRLETPMLFFFACVIATQVSCSSDTTTNPGPPVAAVTVALDASMLTVGHTAQASATVKDSAGNAINGQTVSWASQDTGIAKVSAEGAVTAVAAGSTVIQGKISGEDRWRPADGRWSRQPGVLELQRRDEGAVQQQQRHEGRFSRRPDGLRSRQSSSHLLRANLGQP